MYILDYRSIRNRRRCTNHYWPCTMCVTISKLLLYNKAMVLRKTSWSCSALHYIYHKYNLQNVSCMYLGMNTY